MRGKALTVFIIKIAWLVAALVIWIIALNMFTQSGLAEQWFLSGLLCLIPMAWPVIKFLYRTTVGAAAVGASRWDIDITSSGRLYAHNHAFGYGLIALFLIGGITVLAGLIILPIYWCYMLFTTIMIPVRIHQGYGDE